MLRAHAPSHGSASLRGVSVPSPLVRCGPVELRLATPRAANELFELARDPAVSAQLQWPAHERIDDSLDFIHDANALWQRGSAWLPAIFVEGRLVGGIGLSSIDRPNRRAEVGTWLGVRHQGTGLNVPAKAAMATFAFEHLELARLELLVRVDNARSLAAMRRLPGVREEGVLAQRLWRDGVGHDAVLFAMLAEEFDPAQWPEVEVDP